MIPEATTRDYQKLSMSLLYNIAKRIPEWILVKQQNGKQAYYSRTLVKEELCKRHRKIELQRLGDTE